MTYKPITMMLLALFVCHTKAMVRASHTVQKKLIRQNVAEGIVGGVGGMLIGGSAGFVFTTLPLGFLGSDRLYLEGAQCTALLGSVYCARGAGGRVGLAAWAVVAGGAYLYSKKNAQKSGKKLIARKG